MNNSRKKIKLKTDIIIIALLILIILLCLILLGIYLIVQSFNKSNQGAYKNTDTQVVYQLEEKTFAPPSDTNSWQLILANNKNNIGANYKPQELVTINENVQLDKRIVDDYKNMTQDALYNGTPFWATSGYRDYNYQATLFEKEVEKVLKEKPKYTKKQAIQKASLVVAIPGTSEHQTGLAIDVVSNEHLSLDKDSENSKAIKWLMKNCHNYGFILRYPKNKEHITNKTYEPWHYRYVGIEAATEIMRKNITLEEYLSKK